MVLPDDYLVYRHRSPGPDHVRYGLSPYRERAALTLPEGKHLGLWLTVLVEFFPLDPIGKPFKAPGSVQTPYPDLRNFTARDYGNRVGVYRILDLLEALGCKATFAVQGAVAELYPQLMEDIQAGGHEICAHGWDMDCLHYTGVGEAVERDYIDRTLRAFDIAGVKQPSGWLSPARSESFDTPEIVSEAGFTWFADWTHDSLPTRFRTRSGDLAALPLTSELDDWQILMEGKRPDEEWEIQVADAQALLMEEGRAFGPQILSLCVRPYLLGLPFRIRRLADSLERLMTDLAIQNMVGSDLVNALD